MKKYLLLIALMLVFGFGSRAQSVLGKWKSIDEHTGKAVAIVEIFEKDGKIHGKIVDILNPKDKEKTCGKCPGTDKDKPYMGLLVIKGLKKNGNEYNGGEILDPKHGKLYRCYITTEGTNKLKVRGYLGFSLFGRTQYWHRVE